jgi:hypothetical protein
MFTSDCTVNWVPPDHQAVADQLVLPHPFEVRQILDPHRQGGGGQEENEQQRGADEAGRHGFFLLVQVQGKR